VAGGDIGPWPPGGIDVTDAALSRHFLFLGAVGSGKTTAIKWLTARLRDGALADDVFVFFDAKGDYFRAFGRAGDVVLGADGNQAWNVFADLGEAEHAREIATTLFAPDLAASGANYYFAGAACDVFSSLLLALGRASSVSNEDLLRLVGGDAADVAGYLKDAGASAAADYLTGTPGESVLLCLRKAVLRAFDGRFGVAGEFSVRSFIRCKQGRALFISHDLAIGASLLPVFQVLIDMAVKEALEIGRRNLVSGPGRVFFVLDEFALLPPLVHLGDGINFGRELGLRFIAGTQNMHQVLAGYGDNRGRSMISGFGTVVAFRLMDASSRDMVRGRFGRNRKQIAMDDPEHGALSRFMIVDGDVIEDSVLSSLKTGKCVVAPPEGLPFVYNFRPAPLQVWRRALYFWRLELRWRDNSVWMGLLRHQVRGDYADRVMLPSTDVLLHLGRARGGHGQRQRRDDRGSP
jgi:hypothetical protein